MAQTYSRELDGQLDSSSFQKADARLHRSPLKRIRATIDYDGQAIADDIVLGVLPAGAAFSHGVITASATAGAAATIAIGTAASAALYRTAAVFTAADIPTLFGKSGAASADPVTEETRVIATIGAAALPSSAAFMVVDFFYSDLS